VTEVFLTYLLRSSILLAFTLLLIQLPGLRRAGARDVLLKVALLASIASPFLPTSLLPAIRLEPLVITRASTVSTIEKLPDGSANSARVAEPALVQEDREENQSNRSDWHSIPFILIMIGVLINFVQFGRAWWIVRKLISRGTPITRDLYSELQIEARVRVLSITEISSPAAFGSHTIFIPERLLKNLNKRQLQSVLAHETAHLRRHDPFWNAALSFLSQLCFFQPLNFLALHFWQRASEEICDADASKVTGDPLLLARTLLEVARGQNTLPALLTTSMVSTTHLSKRITSLLNAKEVYMKRSQLIPLSLLPIFATLLLPLVTFAQNTEQTKTVVLDAGHGGIDLGAVGYANEAEVNLSVAQKVRALLEAQGINVVMTREDDSYVELEQRVKFAEGADVFLSLHAQAGPNSNINGIATWFHRPIEITFSDDGEFNDDSGEVGYIDGSTESNNVDLAELTLAHTLQAELINTTGAKNRFTRENTFYVLQTVQVPSIMIDMGFISNPEEGAKLATDSYQQTLAKAIAKTLVDYLE
jgi:N-acetylmuramoyl-L-alanine amidase/beta-lactamase regulating signal transducer with metallopeptidase domain